MLAVLLSSPQALAQNDDEPISGFMICTMGGTISRPFPVEAGAIRGDFGDIFEEWQDFTDSWSGGRCMIGSRAQMDEAFDTEIRSANDAFGSSRVRIVDFEPRWEFVIPSSRRRTAAASSASSLPDSGKVAVKKPQEPAVGPTEAELARMQREAAERERERLAVEETARLNREMADFAAQQAAKNIAARERAAADRKAYEQQLAQVDRERAAYDASMEQHRRELEQANRRQQEYFAAQRRHTLCLNGDRQACADIESGRPVLAVTDMPATPSTDTDATRCVTPPVVSPDSSFRNSTQAVVINGCDTPVDVRLCLMRTGGWNCAVGWNIAPQAQWRHTSFESNGETFWDARVSTSSRELASP